ncbi:18748_t:CDS:2 [Gigaspora margarita]|uniref:18748_t:CDS:1 n=1 Tax=Gigaspora margarita TaxID=4874 RepID=A0ABM8W298_GIGMA|nr:18748_t:CDS:2 [Gigaspora margarita]
MTPDDNGIQRPPKICVDYLSHEWNKEDDIWTSWRVMSKQKKEIANGIRLENASWRTWAKQKYHLKTVNPEKLNWLKDSDVTWLYGPLHTAWHSGHENGCQKTPTTKDELNFMPSSTRHKSFKSCLKKEKSFPETFRPKVKSRLITSNSDTRLYEKLCEKDDDSDISDCETSTCSSISGPSTPLTGPTRFLSPVAEDDDNSIQQLHIRFNDQVEQCIAKKDCSTICKLAPTKLKSDPINSIDPLNNEDAGIIPRLEGDQNEQGIVDRAVNIVHNVRQIVGAKGTKIELDFWD